MQSLDYGIQNTRNPIFSSSKNSDVSEDLTQIPHGTEAHLYGAIDSCLINSKNYQENNSYNRLQLYQELH